MREVTTVTNIMSGDLSIPGRCRLLGIQLACIDDGGHVCAINTDDLGKCTIDLTNGLVAGGESLFKFTIPLGRNSSFGIGVMPIPFMFGSHSILFDEGIFINKLTGTLVNDEIVPETCQLLVFYEGA